MAANLKFGSKQIALPRSRVSRIILGAVLIIGGVLGFLPILGFWMIPLGLYVLSHDFASVRRFRRKATVAIMGKWKEWRR
jgi:purine-cytosine permease-like protein